VEQAPNNELENELYEAANGGNMEKVVSLLEKENINIDFTNQVDGKTLLHLAAEQGNLVLLALLIGKGANPCARDEQGRTPLNIALQNGNKETINLLVSKTLASLDEVSSKYKVLQRINGKNLENFFKLQELRHMYRPPTETKIDAPAISKQLDKIFEIPQRESIFQTHLARESPITEMLRISHFQTIYNIFVAVFLISLANMVVNNYYESGSALEFSTFFFCFRGFGIAFLFWFGMVLGSFNVVVLQKLLVANLLPPKIAYTIYVLYQVFFFVGVPKFVRAQQFGPATGAFVMCETVRLGMKMHSYIMVNNMLRIAKDCDDKDPSVKEFPGNVTFWDFLRFLCFPTLVYQTSYPRTHHVRYNFVFARMTEVCLCIVYLYAITIRYVLPHAPELIGDYKSLLLGIFKVMLPGIGISVLGFFLLLHSWLNAWAEMTRFADRHFYSDWWNALSWSVYYRKWNFVVHNFIHRHVFTELVLLNVNKQVAMWMTFIASAVIHEYVIAVSMGFYKPIMMLMFLIPGVLFIYFTKLFGRNSRGWNVFMWSMLIIGHGCLVGLYSRAWHLFYYNPNAKPDESIQDVIFSLFSII